MTSIGSATRSIQIVSGSSDVTFTSPNRFTMRLPASGFSTGKDECALKSLSLYYSHPNISVALGNNSFSYKWEGVSFPVVMADGIWSFSDIMDYLKQVMMQNGHYLLDAFGNYVFYINFVVNPVLYCLSLTVTPVPNSLPTGWTNPAAITLSGMTPQLVIPAKMAVVTGFAAGTYPAAQQSTLYQVNSGIPHLNGVSSLNVTSNIVNNAGLSLYPNVLASFVVPDSQQPGSLIQLQPANLTWVQCQKSLTFTEISVDIVDQLHRPVELRDPNGFVLIIDIRRQQ